MARLGSRLVAAVVLAGTASAVGAGLGASLTTAEAGAALTTTSPSTVGSDVSTTTPTPQLITTTTLAHRASPLAATLVPCAAPAAGAPCTAEPAEIEISGTPPAAIQVAWRSEKGRPAGAPGPSESTVIVTKSTACAKGVTCWAWPPQLTAADPSGSWILNGGYQVTACVLAATTCEPSSTSTPADVAIAAPASPPASVKTAYSTASGVTVSWKPGATEPPDTVGYEVSRQGEAVYACRTGTSTTPVPAPACSSSLTFRDAPNAGNWIYSVSTLRYGADATTAAVVPSSSRSAFVQVTQQSTTANTQPPYVPDGLPPVPANAPTGSIQPVPPSYTIPPATTSVPHTETTPVTVAPGGPQTLPYLSPGQQSTEVAAAAENGPKHSNLDTWAALAAGLLALALALHVWFLRGQLGTYTAQHSKATRP